MGWIQFTPRAVWSLKNPTHSSKLLLTVVSHMINSKLVVSILTINRHDVPVDAICIQFTCMSQHYSRVTCTLLHVCDTTSKAGIVHPVEWNPTKAGTVETWDFVYYSKVSITQGVMCTHA